MIYRIHGCNIPPNYLYQPQHTLPLQCSGREFIMVCCEDDENVYNPAASRLWCTNSHVTIQHPDQMSYYRQLPTVARRIDCNYSGGRNENYEQNEADWGVVMQTAIGGGGSWNGDVGKINEDDNMYNYYYPDM